MMTSLGIGPQISSFYQWALGIGGVAALGIIIWGGILYITSTDNSSRQDEAKSWITSALIGLLILFGSFAILNSINPNLLTMKDINLPVNPTTTPEMSGTPGPNLFGNNPFLISSFTLRAQRSYCGGKQFYNFGRTSFTLEPVSCPVYPLAQFFNYSDSFCEGRNPGTTGASGVHHAIDIFADRGSSVYAVEDGQIDSPFGYEDTGGNRLWLQGKSGLHYYYAHLQRFAPGIGEGVKVKAGQLLGFVDATGDAVGTPNHLHFEAYPTPYVGYGINAIDPISLLDAACKH